MTTAAPTIAKASATPTEIVAHLQGMIAVGTEAGPFKIGDAVTITDRTGLPKTGNLSDEGIVIAAHPDASFLTVLTLMDGGYPIPLAVRQAALAKFEG